jgi:hypothetical protein
MNDTPYRTIARSDPMFEDKGNWVGIAILVLGGLSAGTMIAYIAAGERATWSGPGWLGTAIVVVGVGLILFMSFQQLRNWFRRRGGQGGDWLGNDTRPQRRWPWQRD